VPPPLNYVLVTITMLGGSAAAGSYAMGLVSDALSSVAFTTSAIVVSAAGAVVVGFPLLVSSLRLLILFTVQSLDFCSVVKVLGIGVS